MHWVLILFIYASAMSHGDSVSLTTIPGFTTQESCQQAGSDANNLTSYTFKSERYICVQQS